MIALAFFVAYCSLSFDLLLLRAVERVVLVLPVEERAGGDDRDQDGRAGARALGSSGQLPTSRMLSRRRSSSVMRLCAFALAGGGAGAAGAGGRARRAAGGGLRLFGRRGALDLEVQRELVDLRIDPSAPGDGTDLISTSSGCVSHGDASMLRISVETRAFDCA